MKPTHPLLVAALSLVALLIAAPAAAVDCFAGNRPFAEKRLDDAIEMFQAALTLPACRDDRIGLQLNLAVALGARAAHTADHCRAAELFEAVNRSTAGTARERVLVKWRVERHRCAVARALDAGDIRVAMGELRRFVDTTDPVEHPELNSARERSQGRLASLAATRVGQVSIQCPQGGRVGIDGLEEARACPARWEDVPAGVHRTGWIDATGAMRTETIRVGPGRLNAFVFAPAPAPAATAGIAADPPSTAADVGDPTTTGQRSRATAWTLTIGAAVLVVGGGAALLVGLDAESDREEARVDILAAQAAADYEADAQAQARYSAAQARVLAFGYTGYGALVAGAALGAAAVWLWTDEASPNVSVGPGGVNLGLTVRF